MTVGVTKESVDLGSAFLEHHGVKGQKWGVRHRAKIIKRQQSNFNRLRRLEAHKGSKTDTFMATMFQVPVGDVILGGGVKGKGGGASRILNRQRKNQAKIKAGKNRITGILQRSLGFDVKKINLKPLKPAR